MVDHSPSADVDGVWPATSWAADGTAATQMRTTMDTTREHLERQVRSTADDLEALVRIVAGDYEPGDDTALLESHGYELDDADNEHEAQEAAWSVLDEWPLEIVEHARRYAGGEWEYTHTVVVFATGGPHVELDTSSRQVIGYWGGDVARCGVSDSVVDHFEEMSGQ